MKEIRVWIPIDINVNKKDFKYPTFENHKEIVFPKDSSPNVNKVNNNNDDEEEEEEENSKDLELESLSSKWIEVMSYSHDVSKPQQQARNGETSKGHIGDISLTKFICDLSPVLNYMTLRGENIPCIIVRCIGDVEDDRFPIIEYEMHNCLITNISISGGAGGLPVESLSVSSQTVILKNIKLNIITGEMETYQVFKWDLLKNSGYRTIVHYNNGGVSTSIGSNLLELAKKRLLVDLDSHDPSTIKLLKELDIVSEYELPKEEEEPELYRVMTNKDPALYQVINIPSRTPSLEIIKKSISDKLGIPLDSIKNLYNSDNGIMVDDCPKILKITNSFIVQTKDGKLYGH